MKGVFQSFFQAGNEVVALDLKRPDATDLSAATTYATEHGYQLRFEQGDATKLKFADGSFDAVVAGECYATTPRLFELLTELFRLGLGLGLGLGPRVRVRVRVRP